LLEEANKISIKTSKLDRDQVEILTRADKFAIRNKSMPKQATIMEQSGDLEDTVSQMKLSNSSDDISSSNKSKTGDTGQSPTFKKKLTKMEKIAAAREKLQKDMAQPDEGTCKHCGMPVNGDEGNSSVGSAPRSPRKKIKKEVRRDGDRDPKTDFKSKRMAML